VRAEHFLATSAVRANALGVVEAATIQNSPAHPSANLVLANTFIFPCTDCETFHCPKMRRCLVALRLFVGDALDRFRSAIDLVPRCIGTASRHPIIVTTRAILSIRARQGRGHHGDQEPKPNSNSLHSIAPRSAGPSHLSHSLILCDVSVLAEPANGSPKSPRHDRKGTGRLPASPDVRQPRPAFRWAFDSDVCSAGLPRSRPPGALTTMGSHDDLRR
jgi:hypothetical protein